VGVEGGVDNGSGEDDKGKGGVGGALTRVAVTEATAMSSRTRI